MTAVTQQLHDYSMYGIRLRSEIPLTFPEEPTAQQADVTLTYASREWFDEITGGDRGVADPDRWYQHRRFDDGSHFLYFPDLFEFVVSEDGQIIRCRELEHSTLESFQTYLLGHVLSYALVIQGNEPLHATAVVVDDVAIAWVGDSGQGKSTLAAAFLAAGHRQLTDDLLRIRFEGGQFVAYPGPPRIKLFPDAAEQFVPGLAAGSPMNPESEKLVMSLPSTLACSRAVPIAAFYVLAGDEACVTPRVEQLFGADAAVQLLAASFNKRVVGSERLRRQFEAVKSWVARIPVWRFDYAWDLTKVEQVRDTIVADMRQVQA